MSETSQIERQRRKRKRAKGKYTIRVRTKYRHWEKLAVDDYGSYAEMYEKYKGTHEFWCGDQPPVHDESGWSGYRLDSDVEPEHTKSTLKRYGKHKCWIQPGLKVNGKPVCLVFNAGGFGGVLGLVGLAIGLHYVSKAMHDDYHRRGVPHHHHDGKLGHRHSYDGHTGRWHTSRKTHKRYRA